MSEPVNHHYLPVFYLSGWCGPDGKVVRYYRPHREVVPNRIAADNTAYEPRLYTLEGYPLEHRQAIERDYMGPLVDEPASKALKVLLARDEPNPSIEVRNDWTRFLMSMSLRDPATVANINEQAGRGRLAKLLEDPEEYLAAKGSDDPSTFTEWVQINAPALLPNVGKHFLPDFIENKEIGTAIMGMRWASFDLARDNDVTLLTGDRPYIRTHGLKDPRCAVLLPLSPRYLFMATHTFERQRQLLKFGTKRIAKDVNAMIVAQAIKHVYGSTDKHLKFVEKRLAPVGHRPD